MSHRLPKKTSDQIDALCEAGNQLMAAGDFVSARRKFTEALQLVPDPKTEWEATTWVIASIGDAHFQQGNFEMAGRAFRDAVRCPGGLGNPFIHLRLGEVAFEAGDHARAADDLARAYMAGGRDAFADEDPKYFALVESVLKPPPGHDRLP